MNKNLSGFSAIIISSVLFASCGNPPPKPLVVAAAIPVVTYQAGEEAVSTADSYPGTVVALNEVELRAQVSGYITGLYVKDGQEVRKGQKLYEIDRSKYDAALRQAQAQVQIAKSNRDKAAKDLARYTKLAEQDAIAKQRVDYAQTDLVNAESLIAGAESALANSSVDLNHAIVTAPLSGTIGISQVKLGALVSAGTTLLNTVSTTNPIAVDIFVGQNEIPRFINLQKKSAGDTFSIQLSDQSVSNLFGKISAIDRAVDPQTGTLKVRISFPNASGVLRSGMSCTVKVLNQDTGKQVTIPSKALTEQMGEFFVYVLGDSNKVSQRRLTLGARVNDKTVVRDGLKPGEKVVVEGVQNLKEGALVQVGEPVAAQKPAVK
ncbi:MAG TPA: efflux RND transporter periplasmic adaptor subunit [Sphingobacteriaceae bacterium]|nr:efflux RND transporter periplasmic adaptor subunit [Sphingobacteriaceae bacterium]